MCSDAKLFSYSMGSNSQKSRASAVKKSSKLTLFEDLLENSENSGSRDYVEDLNQGDSYPSDCESGISVPEQQIRVSDNGLIRICDGEMIHEIIKKKLVSSLVSHQFDVQVESIHRNDYSSIMSKAKLQSFWIYSKAMEMNCGGNANVKYAWFGASRNEINGVLSHGFGLPIRQGVYLSPVEHPIGSVELAVPDEDGLKHMLLCRVIMGKMEEICPNSEQYNPSCEEFDSGVDNLASPRKYIVWSSRMNTHILPEFVISFRAFSSYKGNQHSRRPNSDWMPFPSLIIALSKFLPPDAIESITKHHDGYRKQKVTRHEMIQRVRQIAGDKLLMAIIKSYRGKNKASGSKGSINSDQLKRSN